MRRWVNAPSECPTPKTGISSTYHKQHHQNISTYVEVDAECMSIVNKRNIVSMIEQRED